MIYNIVKYLSLVILSLFYRLRVEGSENIPTHGPVIMAANHTSYTDPVIVAAVSKRKVSYMAKEELFRIPVISWFMRSLRAFPVRRGKSDRIAFQRALEVLADDKILGIFPEGKRQRLDGKLGPLEEGMALLAIKSKATVMPIAIIGSDKIIPEGKKLPRFPKITVRIGHAIHLDEYIGPEKERRKMLTAFWSEEVNRLARKAGER